MICRLCDSKYYCRFALSLAGFLGFIFLEIIHKILVVNLLNVLKVNYLERNVSDCMMYCIYEYDTDTDTSDSVPSFVVRFDVSSL